jgi:hypothetical protein
VAFNLIYPSNNRALTSWGIPFRWGTSVDPNDDPVEYIFHLKGPNIDTTMTGLEDDSLYFDASTRLLPYTNYTWYVEATDGNDTIVSNSQRVFKTPKATDVATTLAKPEKYALGQNYPNPFNPRTVIPYGIARAGIVTLKVFDIFGREVCTLIDRKYMTAGEHEMPFDAVNLASGVFFYRLQTGTFVETKRMTLIK